MTAVATEVGEAAIQALAGVTVTFPREQSAAIVGPSASGRSTLMQRVAVAWAIASRPEIVFAGEARGALEFAHRHRDPDLRAPGGGHGRGVIAMVTHDAHAVTVMSSPFGSLRRRVVAAPWRSGPTARARLGVRHRSARCSLRRTVRPGRATPNETG